MREVFELENRCDEFLKFDITDISTVSSMKDKSGDDSQSDIFYETESVAEYFKNHISSKISGEEMRISDYQWIPIKAGYIIFSSNQAYFLNVGVRWLKSDKKSLNESQIITPSCYIKSSIEIKFQVGTTDLTIEGAYE